MNAAVRAVVRMGLFVGARVFLIREGYQGFYSFEMKCERSVVLNKNDIKPLIVCPILWTKPRTIILKGLVRYAERLFK